MSLRFIIKLNAIPWSVTPNDIAEHFRECKIRRGTAVGVHIITLPDGRPSGEAYVEFEDEEDVRLATREMWQLLGGQYVKVEQVTGLEMDYVIKKSGPEYDYDNDGTVRMRGLPYECTTEDIARFFEGFEIKENGITIILDALDQSTGIGFVQFINKQVATQALSKHGAQIGHRYIELFSSTIFEKMASLENASRRIFMRTIRRHPHDGEHYGFYVTMRGLPYEATHRDIINFFHPIEPARIFLIDNEVGQPSGIADVEFRSHEDALSAMEKDREYMKHRFIELFLNSTPVPVAYDGDMRFEE